MASAEVGGLKLWYFVTGSGAGNFYLSDKTMLNELVS